MKPCQDGSSFSRGAVLRIASRVINGDRQDMYGNPEDTHEWIAKLWNVWAQARKERDGHVYFTPEDAMLLMALFKIGRELGGAGKLDNIVDACGYLALYADAKGYAEDCHVDKAAGRE